jgi:N-glycosidase YbiA
VKRAEHSYAEVKNEVTTEEILEYAAKVKSGQIAYEVNSHGYRSDLSPLHMRELEIDGRKWPSLEHYMLAQQFEDTAFQDEIRTTRTITQIRKLIKGRPVRSDWESVRDGVMTKALEVKFADRYLKALLLSTHGFSIKVKHADPYWGAPRNRAGELMAELRERLFAIQENRMLVGLFKGTEYESAAE